MITFTGLVFSITVVVLVLASNQFSPRTLRTFLRDRTIQWSLGIFVATFVYAMTVIRTVLGTNGDGAFVPRVAVTVAFLLVVVSVGLFIVYVSHIANMIRVSSIIATIGELLALTVNGVDLSLDHGFPARVIVPANPGVHNTKWVGRMTFEP